MSAHITKLSPSIENLLKSQPNGTRRVVLHAGCFSCKRHLINKNIKIVHELPLVNAFVVDMPVRAMPIMATKGYVRYIEDDVKVKLTLDKAKQTVSAHSLKYAGVTGKGITIAAIDTGIYPHDDFLKPSNRIICFVDLVSERTSPYDDNGHGTFCMSCAGGSGAASHGEYAGIASEANLIMIKAMDAQGGGTISNILRAMQWVSDNKDRYNIRILSMSLGVEADDVDSQHDSLSMAAGALWRQGVVVVAAAGNSGPRPDTVNSPGIEPSIITVGAVDDREEKLKMAKFSSRGPERNAKKPDVLAPGVEVTAAKAQTNYLEGGPSSSDQYTQMSGTSVSTPIVAGCIALILEKNPDLTPDQVKTALITSAKSIGAPRNAEGAGVVWLEEAGAK